MHVNTPLRNTLQALALIPMLAFMAAKKLLVAALAALFLAVVFLGTIALAVAVPLLVATVINTLVIAALNYVVHVAFGVAMLSGLKLVASGFVCAVVTPLVRRLR